MELFFTCTPQWTVFQYLLEYSKSQFRLKVEFWDTLPAMSIIGITGTIDKSGFYILCSNFWKMRVGHGFKTQDFLLMFSRPLNFKKSSLSCLEICKFLRGRAPRTSLVGVILPLTPSSDGFVFRHLICYNHPTWLHWSIQVVWAFPHEAWPWRLRSVKHRGGFGGRG